MRTLIKNGTIVTAVDQYTGDVLIEDERIAVIGMSLDALAANVELFRQRYGELPGLPQNSRPESSSMDVWPGSSPNPAHSNSPAQPNNPGQSDPTSSSVANTGESNPTPDSMASQAGSQQPTAPNQTNHLRRQNPQEVYDDLKLRDEILSGAYANAVMIGHGPYEFSFDFITNFYPQSAVSCRVYLASGHIHRLLESLRASWEQLRPRLSGNPPPNPPPPQPPR